MESVKKKSYEKEEFIQRYYHHFNEGLLDREIADKLFIHEVTLSLLKKEYDIVTERRRKNEFGISENHFKIAQANGFPRWFVLQRVRSGYSIQQAISLPKRPGKKL